AISRDSAQSSTGAFKASGLGEVLMALSIRQRSGPAPLTVQVTQAERRLLYHRRMLGFRASRLSQNLRRQLASPTVLLLAGGLGFVTGQLKKRDADDAERPA